VFRHVVFFYLYVLALGEFLGRSYYTFASFIHGCWISQLESKELVTLDMGRVWLLPVKFLKMHLSTFEVLNID